MPTYEKDLEKIRSLQDAASEKTRMATDLSGTSITLHDNIMAAVREDRASRGVSQMAKDVGATSGQLASDPRGIRERMDTEVNPMDVDRFTSAQRAQNMNTLGTIATQGQRNYGTLTDIISAGANQLKAMAQSKMAEAQQKAAEAENLMTQLNFQEQIRQFNESLAEKQRQFDLNFGLKSGGSGGGITIPGGVLGGGSGEGLQEDFDVIEDKENDTPTLWQEIGRSIERDFLDPAVDKAGQIGSGIFRGVRNLAKAHPLYKLYIRNKSTQGGGGDW